MLRREPSRTTTVSDWELGIAAVLLLDRRRADDPDRPDLRLIASSPVFGDRLPQRRAAG